MPSFFIAHGSPLIAIEDNEYTQFLQTLGGTFPKPAGVVLFSAHWESTVQLVSDVKEYDTIYDFYGFPEEMYNIKYPAKGSPTIVKYIEEMFAANEIPFETETKRGLDHGAWVILKFLYPNGEIPVISMSVNPSVTPEEQYKIGQSLAELRRKDILIIGSGGTVHNLRALRRTETSGNVDPWALEFDNWLAMNLSNWDLNKLFKYDSLAPHADYAVPRYGNEHFIPIFYAMGAADHERTAKLIHRSFRYGNLSHSVWQFG